MFEKGELKIFMGEDDSKASNDLFEKIIPLIKGMTLRQVRMAFRKTMEAIECNKTIS